MMLTHAISELCHSLDDVGERLAEAPMTKRANRSTN